MQFRVDFSQPTPWTFTMPPVRAFLGRWLDGCGMIIDPFCGRSIIGTLRNDLADGGVDAGDWCKSLLEDWSGMADAVIFDPPYSPTQVKRSYAGIGLKPKKRDTQTGRLYRDVRSSLRALLKPGGVALSFGWSSTGFGRAWPTQEILLVRHGGAHNDTICVAQTKPLQRTL